MGSKPLHSHPHGYLIISVNIFSFHTQEGGIRCRHLVGRGQCVTMHKTNLPLHSHTTKIFLAQNIFSAKAEEPCSIISSSGQKISIVPHCLWERCQISQVLLVYIQLIICQLQLLFWSNSEWGTVFEMCCQLSRLHNFGHTNHSNCIECPLPTAKVKLKCFLLYETLHQA